MTILNVELGKKTVDETEVKEKLLKHLANLFEAKLLLNVCRFVLNPI